MNYYIVLINDVIDYIEENLESKLSLSVIANRAGISAFHFSRIFKGVTGISLKQYTLNRKLEKAQVLLTETQCSILEIALTLGFEYPEVFNRAFKRQFGQSPSAFRKNTKSFSVTSRLSVIERDIANYRGTLAVKGKIIYLESMTLYGVDFSIDTTKPEFREKMDGQTQPFIIKSGRDIRYEHSFFYTIVKCSGKEDGLYQVFCGRKMLEQHEEEVAFHIPEGYYAAFEYTGDMYGVREVFEEDLYRWLVINEAVIADNDIGMMTMYPNAYPEENSVQIFVPIEAPNTVKSQQERS